MNAVFAILILGGLFAAGPIMSDVERPTYEVITQNAEGNIEVRRYAPMMVAEVTVEGTRRDASGDGFRLLADYIFGNNTVATDIAMTAPVEQQAASQKIAMTAPVEQRNISHSNAKDNAESTWQIRFVMPSEWTRETLPVPNNPRVIIKEIPAEIFVAITFSGRATDDNIARHTAELEAYLAAENLTTEGAAKYAFYNPPWTLPFMRRNEVMFQLADN